MGHFNRDIIHFAATGFEDDISFVDGSYITSNPTFIVVILSFAPGLHAFCLVIEIRKPRFKKLSNSWIRLFNLSKSNSVVSVKISGLE